MSHYETNPETQLRSIEFIFGKPFYEIFENFIFFHCLGSLLKREIESPIKPILYPLLIHVGKHMGTKLWKQERLSGNMS